MTLWFSHGLMNANIFDMMNIYIYIYWHEVYGNYMLVIYACMVCLHE